MNILLLNLLARVGGHSALANSIPIILAQAANIDGAIDDFLRFLGKLLLIIAVAMLIYAGLLAHDGKTREAVFALIGAFILSVAVPAARIIFNLSGGWTN